MLRQQNPTLFEYLAGGLLGNTLMLFTLLALTFLDPSFISSILVAINLVVFGSLFAGALLAAFYVAVEVQSSNIYRVVTVGAVTGAFSYLMNLVLSFFFYYFFNFQLPVSDYMKLAMFIPGGMVGAYIRMKRKRVRRLAPV